MHRIILALMLLPIASVGHASNLGLERIYEWCSGDSVDYEMMPRVCYELQTQSLLDELKTTLRVLGLVDATGNSLNPAWRAILSSVFQCVEKALLQNMDAFGYPTLIECVDTAIRASTPPVR